MQTCLFFLYPKCAIAAIIGVISISFPLFITAALLSTVFLLLFFYFDSKRKTALSRTSIGFYLVAQVFFLIFCIMPFPSEPKINSMHPTPTRLVINTTDIMQINSCSDSTASRKMQQIKDAKGKQAHQEVTIKEYAEYYGLDYKEVCEFLKLVK